MKLNLSFEDETEISLECNPENIDLSYLKEARSAGVNRVNVGVQSFNEMHLRTLGRYYDKNKYDVILQNLQQSGFSRVGCDLIYGIPGQTKISFYEDLKRLIEGGVNHLSLYSLTAEKGTLYDKRISEKKASPPDETIQTELLLELPSFLESKGFEQYEVSNYAKKGFHSKHNLKYWTMEYYLSLGPGAHGYTLKGRYANSGDIENYLNNNFSLKYETPLTSEELILTLFRIFLPINLNSFLILLPTTRKDSVIRKIKEWSNMGYCDYENGIFQWAKKSVLHLDFFIQELSEL